MSSVKPEVQSISQRRQRGTKARPQNRPTQKLVEIEGVVPEIWSPTHRQTDHSTQLPSAANNCPAGGMKCPVQVFHERGTPISRRDYRDQKWHQRKTGQLNKISQRQLNSRPSLYVNTEHIAVTWCISQSQPYRECYIVGVLLIQLFTLN